MLSQDAVTGYVNGCADQFEWNHTHRSNSPTWHARKPKLVHESDENKAAFNLAFNNFINRFNERRRADKTPPAMRNRSYYADLYRIYFDGLCDLFREFPDAISREDYDALEQSYQRYRELCAYFAGMSPADYWRLYDWDSYKKNDDDYNWRYWPNLPRHYEMR